MDIVVGNVAVRVNDCPGPYVPVWGDKQGFVAAVEHPDIVLEIEQAPELTVPRQAVLAFDAGPLWSAYRLGTHYLLAFWHGEELGRLVEVDPENWTGVIHLREEEYDRSLATRAPRYPLFTLLVSWYVTRRGGLLLHACGLDAGGQGLVFCGPSEVGKTTIARLWQQREGAVILHDDRVMVQPDGDGFAVLGTPWYSGACARSNSVVPLRALFFLGHGPDNHLANLSLGEGVARLYAASVLPLHDSEAREVAFNTIGRLFETIPPRAYHFVPDSSAVDFLQHILTGRETSAASS